MRMIFRIALIAVLLTGVASLPAAAEPYLSAREVQLTPLMVPPPLVGSDAYKADMQADVDTQKTRTPAQADEARADSLRSVFRFAGVFGPNFNEQKLPLTKALFRDVAVETEELTDEVKHVFKRSRPFVDNPELHPIIATPGEGQRPSGQTPSFPSGHSTFAYTTGILLSAMIPEKRREIFERSESFSHNRLVAGVHFPTDIEAGRVCGTVIAYLLLHNERFAKDFAKAREELRHVLELE